jgi:hypothetical protein
VRNCRDTKDFLVRVSLLITASFCPGSANYDPILLPVLVKCQQEIAIRFSKEGGCGIEKCTPAIKRVEHGLFLPYSFLRVLQFVVYDLSHSNICLCSIYFVTVGYFLEVANRRFLSPCLQRPAACVGYPTRPLWHVLP